MIAERTVEMKDYWRVLRGPKDRIVTWSRNEATARAAMQPGDRLVRLARATTVDLEWVEQR